MISFVHDEIKKKKNSLFRYAQVDQNDFKYKKKLTIFFERLWPFVDNCNYFRCYYYFFFLLL